MPSTPVNYDQIAPAYHQRYHLNPLPGIASALRALTQSLDAQRILEVGCGTGRWLVELRPVTQHIFGLDLSPGMLRQARQESMSLALACGEAGQLPFPNASFDFVYCVNALHHFSQPRAFVAEARRLLRPGGALAIVGMDPHAGREDWFLYHYFEGTYEADLRRFPSSGTMLDWLIAAGFERAEWRVAERIRHQHVGREVLADHFVQKHGTSQLTLLTDEAYAAGLARIEAALAEAEAAGKELIFPVDISLVMVLAYIQAVQDRFARRLTDDSS